MTMRNGLEKKYTIGAGLTVTFWLCLETGCEMATLACKTSKSRRESIKFRLCFWRALGKASFIGRDRDAFETTMYFPKLRGHRIELYFVNGKKYVAIIVPRHMKREKRCHLYLTFSEFLSVTTQCIDLLIAWKRVVKRYCNDSASLMKVYMFKEHDGHFSEHYIDKLKCVKDIAALKYNLNSVVVLRKKVRLPNNNDFWPLLSHVVIDHLLPKHFTIGGWKKACEEVNYTFLKRIVAFARQKFPQFAVYKIPCQPIVYPCPNNLYSRDTTVQMDILRLIYKDFLSHEDQH